MLETPKANRLHIAIFGRRNAGKSSLINALAHQDVAIVSAYPGTTTDPVYKAMEILPIGPVMLIDTAGIDDSGDIGELRVKRSLNVLAKADMVLIVIDAANDISEYEYELLEMCLKKNIPFIAVINKVDIKEVSDEFVSQVSEAAGKPPVLFSAKNGQGVEELITTIINSTPQKWEVDYIVSDLLKPQDTVVLVVPIDSAAPKGRIILPQVQTLRDILDHHSMAYVVQEDNLKTCLDSLKTNPKMVITDSQVFEKVNKIVPESIMLTSFSILFARYKGDLASFVEGSMAIKRLKPGDKVLIAEACTHHRMEDDIGTVKLPRWLEKYINGKLAFEWCSGNTFPDNLHEYKLVIHCGACMINRREMLSRILACQQSGVPIVNYGIAIAFLCGILPRTLSPFSSLQQIITDADTEFSHE